MDDTLKIIKEIGIPSAALLGILYMLWVAGRAIGSEILMPSVKKHLAFLDSLTAHLQSQEVRDIGNGSILESVASSIKKLADHPDLVSSRLDAVDRHLKNNADWTAMLHEELLRRGVNVKPPKG